MKRIAIVAAKRSAVGTFSGGLRDVPADKLGAAVLRELVETTGIDAVLIDQVVAGNVLSAGLGQNIARQAAIGAGLPIETTAYSVDMVCGSGLKAVCLGASAILAGEADIVAAGGVENMSRVPYALPGLRAGVRMGDAAAVDLMVRDGLWDVFNDYHMGITAENLADRWDISREAMDAFALRSQRLAAKAIDEGRFVDEIVPIPVAQKKGDPIPFSIDEHPRRNTTEESLAKLAPAFKPDGRVTAGNSSGINDGAAFVLLMSEAKARELKLEPLGFIAAYASAGVDPAYMGYGPVPATEKALRRAGWKLGDIELAELNEAFASQSLAVLKGFEKYLGGIDQGVVNVNGGAIAIGHPIGASGARILVSLLYEMKRRNAKRGLSALCIGGGLGISLLVERN